MEHTSKSNEESKTNPGTGDMTLRTSLGLVSEKVAEAFDTTETFDFNVKLEGVEAKKVAALCAMIESAFGKSKEETMAYVVAVGMANIRTRIEGDQPA